ncbi:MAG: glycosyltransferase family 39 protein [Deltaproteobacteria bacterium]|nr:glycosyltransferase family 39 protein [Deltaproteobacteria bacterium]
MRGPIDLPGGHLIRAQTCLLWAAFALVAVAGAVLLRRWLREPRAPGAGRQALGLLAVGLLALGLRLFVSPHTILHENAHGYEFLRGAFRLDGFPYHGQAYYAFFYLLTSVFGRHPEVVFTTNALLGTASVLLLVPLGRRLTGHASAGWIAAVGYACWPAVLRISATESFFNLGICVALLAWLAWLRAWETGETLRFALAAALIAVVVQARPEFAAWPVVLLLSLPACPGWSAALRRTGPWVGLVVVALLAAAWVEFRLQVQSAWGLPEFMHIGPASTLHGFTTRHNLLLRPEWTPAAVWALAALGVAGMAVGRWRTLPALVGGVLVMGWMVMAVDVSDTTRLRLQSPVHPLILLAVGTGVAAAAARLEGSARTAALVLLGGALLVTSALRFPLVREPLDPQREFAFLSRTVRTLPEGCAVITAERSMAHNVVITEFPVWWLRGPVEYSDRYLRWPESLDGYPCRFFYRGLSCYLFAGHEAAPADGIRPECRAIGRRHRLVPHAETTFPSRPYGDHAVPARTITLGFYRLEPLAPAAATQP